MDGSKDGSAQTPRAPESARTPRDRLAEIRFRFPGGCLPGCYGRLPLRLQVRNLAPRGSRAAALAAWMLGTAVWLSAVVRRSRRIERARWMEASTQKFQSVEPARRSGACVNTRLVGLRPHNCPRIAAAWLTRNKRNQGQRALSNRKKTATARKVKPAPSGRDRRVELRQVLLPLRAPHEAEVLEQQCLAPSPLGWKAGPRVWHCLGTPDRV